MSIENLPLALLNKHLESLALDKPLYIQSEADIFAESKTEVASAVVFLPKSKSLIDLTLACTAAKVINGGTIILVGEKKGGIESAKKLYETNIGPVDQKIVGNHSALYVGKNKKLGARKKIEDYLTFSPITYKDETLEIAQLPGVFSAGELDEGTKLLLETVPYTAKNILDMGCGAGVIGVFYKKQAPASDITMSDASVLATKATAETFKKNNLAGRVFLSDVFDSISGSFDLILCNPPFHSGISTDYSFIERFARGAKAHLKPNGEVYVVANSFLSYKETLEKHIGPTEIVAENPKFKVFKARAL
jgi:16S rRNA (guanine1207-N2)-methyltransferase